MSLFRRIAAVIILTAGLYLLLTPRAYAYLDPGTGSYIFQAIIAFSIGAAFTLRVFWNKIKAFFRRKNAEGK